MPREPDYTVTFAVRESDIEPAGRNFSSEEMELEFREINDEIVFFDYEYESDSRFGGTSTAEGLVLFDTNSPLFAITTLYDNPKAKTLLRKMNDVLPSEVSAPDLTAESQHNIYHDYGFGQGVNGYTISFKDNSTSYEINGDGMGRTLDPEDEAEERCKYSGQRFSDDMVHEIAEDAMSDGMYIWSCDLVVQDETISFSDPGRFTGVDKEFAKESGFNSLFKVMREAR